MGYGDRKVFKNILNYYQCLFYSENTVPLPNVSKLLIMQTNIFFPIKHTFKKLKQGIVFIETTVASRDVLDTFYALVTHYASNILGRSIISMDKVFNAFVRYIL